MEQGHREMHQGQLGGREHKEKGKQDRLMGCGLWIGQCAYERCAQSKSSTIWKLANLAGADPPESARPQVPRTSRIQKI